MNSGFLYTPDRNGDGFYDHNEMRLWHNIGETYNRIEVDIIFVQIEFSFKCLRDRLQVRQFSSKRAQIYLFD